MALVRLPVRVRRSATVVLGCLPEAPWPGARAEGHAQNPSRHGPRQPVTAVVDDANRLRASADGGRASQGRGSRQARAAATAARREAKRRESGWD